MNKPYTCHNCSTQFDAFPDDHKAIFDGARMPAYPRSVTVKCPGCYDAGYTQVAQMTYVLDISGDATLV